MVFWRELKLKAVAFKKGQQQPSVAVSNACFIIMNKLVGWFLGGGGFHRFPVPCQSNWVKKQSFLYRVDYLFLLFFATRYLPFFSRNQSIKSYQLVAIIIYVQISFSISGDFICTPIKNAYCYKPMKKPCFDLMFGHKYVTSFH